MNRVPLPPEFLDRPIAHRALHDLALGRPENSRAAVRAAVEAGYGIEIDLQQTADGAAMVFHDYDMGRLTGTSGPIRMRPAGEVAAMPLVGGDGEGVPTFTEILDIVAGKVPLLVEIKDQDGAMGSRVGELEASMVRSLEGYAGPVAVMSFNPESVAEMARLAPHLPRGLTTSDYDPADWPLNDATCTRLREIPDVDRVGAGFISHQHTDLARPRVQDLKSAGMPVLCWTVRSPEEEANARRYADNVTFEGYTPAPAA